MVWFAILKIWQKNVKWVARNHNSIKCEGEKKREKKREKNGGGGDMLHLCRTSIQTSRPKSSAMPHMFLSCTVDIHLTVLEQSLQWQPHVCVCLCVWVCVCVWVSVLVCACVCVCVCNACLSALTALSQTTLPEVMGKPSCVDARSIWWATHRGECFLLLLFLQPVSSFLFFFKDLSFVVILMDHVCFLSFWTFNTHPCFLFLNY